jgi:rhodanese-related sulfurtransferase
MGKKGILFLLFGALLFAFQQVPATLKNVLLLKKYNVPLVDIRPPQEIKITGMIKWAVNIPMISRYGGILYNNVTLFQRRFKKGATIALITKTGLDAIPVARVLEQHGYRVIILRGGYNYLFKDMLLNMDKFLTMDIIKRL